MRYPIDQERELMERVFALKDDPVAFAHLMYPWGEKGTPLENVTGLRTWQQEELELIAAHMKRTREAGALGLVADVYRKAWSSGRGPGKSALFGIAAHWHVSTHIGAQTIVTANTEGQLRTKTFPEISRWIGMALNSHWFNVEGLKIEPDTWFSALVSEQLKIDPRYWNISGQTWTEENPEAYAGAHNAYGLMVIFDEASGIHSVVWDKTKGFFTDQTPYRFHLAGSQMTRASGRFYDLFFDPKLSIGWATRMIDIRGMADIDQKEVQATIDTYGVDSDIVRVEVLGQPPNLSELQFIPTDSVVGAQTREIPYGDSAEPLVMGVDPAPRGRTVIRFRAGRNARDCCGKDTVVVLQGADNVGIANEVARLHNKYKPESICVDFGMGTGVIDTLRHTHKLRVVEVRFGETPADGKKSEWATVAISLWAKMRDWLPGAMIDKSPELFRDLIKREWRWTQRGRENKKILESKEELRARGIPSPDDADALACTFASNPPRRDAKLSRGARSDRAEGTREAIM